MNQQRLLCSCSPTDLPSATQYRCTFLHTLLVPWHALLGSRVPYHSWYGRSLTLMDMIIAAFSFPLGIYTRPRTGTDTQYALHTTHSRLARFHSATSKPPIMSHALSFPFRMPPLPFPAHPFPVYIRPQLLTVSTTLASSPSSVYGHIAVIGFAPVGSLQLPNCKSLLHIQPRQGSPHI